MRKTLILACIPLLLLTACGGGGGSSNIGPPPPPPPGQVIATPGPPNVEPVILDAGPANGPNFNTAFVTVTVCIPGGACQNIDHVEVDTGSTGLRLLHASAGGELTPQPAACDGTGRHDARGVSAVCRRLELRSRSPWPTSRCRPRARRPPTSACRSSVRRATPFPPAPPGVRACRRTMSAPSGPTASSGWVRSRRTAARAAPTRSISPPAGTTPAIPP